MAIEFNGGADALTLAAAAATVYPITMACWVYKAVDADVDTAMSIGASGASTGIALGMNATENTYAQAIEAGAASSATSTTATVINTWAHIAGVFTSSSLRAAFLNGGGKATNAIGRSIPAVNQTAIGRSHWSAGGAFWTGYIAEAAIWDAALEDNEIYNLSRGVPAWLVRPTNLVLYSPLYGRVAAEYDLIGGRTWTHASTPTFIAHPKIGGYTRNRIIKPNSAPAAFQWYPRSGFAELRRPRTEMVGY